MAEIINFNAPRLNTAANVLESALQAGVQEIMILGYDKDGEEYFASSIADGGDCLWLTERAKKRLMEYQG